MTLLVRNTDVLGGSEPSPDPDVVLGGIIGGFRPFNLFRGWRTYSVVDSYTDPDGIELPAIRIRKSSGPITDTLAQLSARTKSLFVPRTWPYPEASGSYPALAWYFLDPATLAHVAGPLLPLGRSFNEERYDPGVWERTPATEHVVQWFEHTLPTGPYIGILVSREPSVEHPLWVSGHPIEIVTDCLTKKGEEYDTASAAAVQASMGSMFQHQMAVTDSEQTPQELIDTLGEAYGFTVRRSLTNGKAEFVYWRQKVQTLPATTLTTSDLRDDGGPTFDIGESTRVTRVRVTGEVISAWRSGMAQRVEKTLSKAAVRRVISSRKRQRMIAQAAYQDSEKPASGLIVTSADVTFDYSSDGVTPDAEKYGEQEVEVSLNGMPAVTNSTAGGASPLNLEQWAEGVARMVFSPASRGRQMAKVRARRGTDADLALLGEAVTLDIEHGVNPQLGQSPTSQRGGARPYRVVERTPEGAHPDLLLADEGTGVQYGVVPDLTVTEDSATPGMWLVTVNNAAALQADGAQVEFQCKVFAPDATPDFTDPGFRYTVDDATDWSTDTFRFGPFPLGHQVFFRASAWLFDSSASNWHNWCGKSGCITGPQTTLSDLIIDQITDDGARLTWSYDELPQVGDVRVQHRNVTTLIGPWVDAAGSPFAAGTETATLTGLGSGNIYEVRVVLIDGASVEYGDVLLGRFATTGGKISSLAISSVTSEGAKLEWTNTDATYQVLVEYRVDGTTQWQTFIALAPTSNRIRLIGLLPVTDYEVQVSLLGPGGDGAGGPPLSGSFTTLAATVQLDFPLIGGAFEAWDPATALRHDGRFGVRLHANPNNVAIVHDIVVLLAVETSIGSGTPGTFVEQLPIPATPGVDLWFTADAPNDGKLRYMKALSRAVGYTDSIETIVMAADPWPETGPTPPAGGGIPNTHDVSGTGVAAGASVTGSFLIPDGAELFRVDSPNAKAIRIRLYMNSTVLASDELRAATNSAWPAGLLFDAEVLASEGYSIVIDVPQRIRFILAQHEDQRVWFRLTNLESGTEDVQCRLFYFAAPLSGLP